MRGVAGFHVYSGSGQPGFGANGGRELDGMGQLVAYKYRNKEENGILRAKLSVIDGCLKAKSPWKATKGKSRPGSLQIGVKTGGKEGVERCEECS